jgi:hypothetical protein
VTGRPGLANQRGVRLFFQIVGPVLVVVGLALFVAGVRAVFGHMDDFDGPSGADVARFMGGFLVFGVGLQLTRVGFLAASARYVSGEVSPVIKDAYAHVTERTGPFCSKCGVRQDDDARFCDACGSPVG